MSFTYLASPYSHADKQVMEERHDAVCRHAAKMMFRGEAVFCPIAHSHVIAMHMVEGMATEQTFWQGVDAPFINGCNKLVVLMLDGWDKSHGVAHEIKTAVERHIPIEYVNPEVNS